MTPRDIQPHGRRRPAYAGRFSLTALLADVDTVGELTAKPAALNG